MNGVDFMLFMVGIMFAAAVGPTMEEGAWFAVLILWFIAGCFFWLAFHQFPFTVQLR